MQLRGDAIPYDFELKWENIFSLSFEANSFGGGKGSYYFRRCLAK